MHITLTGSHGFVGSHLRKHLEQAGHELDCWDIKIQKNISDIVISSNTDLVIHLAALAGIRESFAMADKFWEVNVTHTKNIFQQSEKQNKRIIYASSSACARWYGNPYSISKYVNEFIAPKNSVGLRFSTVWGEGARGDMLVPQIQNKTLQYATTHKRDLIHVSDVVSAIQTIIDHPEQTGVFEVGTGRTVAVDELVAYNGLDVPIKSGEDFELENNLLPSHKLRALGWEPKKFIMAEKLCN